MQNNIGMREPLTDAEGYPRNDVDVYQVRIARNKIICKSYTPLVSTTRA
jgi:26S proteasome non-ATPase regulatory subunit 9